MTFTLATILALALFLFAAWRTKQSRRPAGTNTLLSGTAQTAPETGQASAADGATADVAASANTALKRLLPVMVSRGIRADTAIRQGLLVGMSRAALTDLLEELLTGAVHNAGPGRMLLSATARGKEVDISLTDNALGVDATQRALATQRLAHLVTLRGGVLDIHIRPGEGTTTTLRVTAAASDDGAFTVADDPGTTPAATAAPATAASANSAR